MKEMRLERDLLAFRPFNEQEACDREEMLRIVRTCPNCFSRENLQAHFCASAWTVDEKREQTLMAYHRIYDAWAWTGGHADGETDLLAVALREAQEETGVLARPLRRDIFSLEILTVDGHEKRGRYVPSHLHLNVTYLLEASREAPLRSKPDENLSVRWFPLEEALRACSERWMVQRVYSKLNAKLAAWQEENQR